jgi:hypothetical protein
VRQGKANGCPVSLFRQRRDYFLMVEARDGPRMLQHEDAGVLERFYKLMFESILWD